MKIIVEYTDFQNDLIEIISANYVGDFVMRLVFSDGANRLVDFKTFMEFSLHPSIGKYLIEDKFKQFDIVDGNLNWNNCDLIFPINDLYQGKL